jgi:LCP family protein required for cell wall assembly
VRTPDGVRVFSRTVRTTLKRGIGRTAAVNGDGRAVLPPGVLSPVTRYRQPERKRGALPTVGRVLFFLLAACVAVVLGIAGGTYLWAVESVAATSPQEEVKVASRRLNIPLPNQPKVALVIGYDHRPEDGNAPSRSDTLMLLRADPDGNTLSLLSFPRDLIVEIRCPDGRSAVDRINTAYAYCGPEGTLETVRTVTGLPIHYLIAVNFEGFRQVVDKIGGVPMDVDRRYLNAQGGDYATINLWPGYQRLTGWQALDFVRYRHTDSDLYRLARQQSFVKAMKQTMRHKWKNPKNVFKIIGALRKNVQIGQGGGKGVDPDTLKSYLLFAYGLPAGNFFQVKIGGLSGTNELRTDASNIQAAVDEFEHPDVEAPRKATAQALHRNLSKKTGPRPKSVSIVVLNGNGRAGAAANTSYLLAQKGYRVISPPEGFQANAPGKWSRTFRTQVFFSGRNKARLAADSVSSLFNSADVAPLPARNKALSTLSNGAMVTVIVGLGFTGRLTPTPVDRTPPREPPHVRAAKSETLPVVRAAAAWKLGFPLQFPTVIESSSVVDSEVPFRVYKLDDAKTVRFTFRNGSSEYWGIQETDWDDAPALEDKNFSAVIHRRQYDFYYNGPHLHMVVLRAGGASYWVVNTLLDRLSNETMLEIAKGLRPLHK